MDNASSAVSGAPPVRFSSLLSRLVITSRRYNTQGETVVTYCYSRFVKKNEKNSNILRYCLWCCDRVHTIGAAAACSHNVCYMQTVPIYNILAGDPFAARFVRREIKNRTINETLAAASDRRR